MRVVPRPADQWGWPRSARLGCDCDCHSSVTQLTSNRMDMDHRTIAHPLPIACRCHWRIEATTERNESAEPVAEKKTSGFSATPRDSDRNETIIRLHSALDESSVQWCALVLPSDVRERGVSRSQAFAQNFKNVHLRMPRECE